MLFSLSFAFSLVAFSLRQRLARRRCRPRAIHHRPFFFSLLLFFGSRRRADRIGRRATGAAGCGPVDGKGRVDGGGEV